MLILSDFMFNTFLYFQDEIPKKLKKTKKRKPVHIVPATPTPNLDPCFIRGQTGEVVACQNKICNKFYHLKCVDLEVWPEGYYQITFVHFELI